MSTKKPGAGGGLTGDADADDWASALDEWDAQIDNQLTGGAEVEQTAVGAAVEDLPTDLSLEALPAGGFVAAGDQDELLSMDPLPPDKQIMLEDPLPLDEPPPSELGGEPETAQEVTLPYEERGEDALREMLDLDLGKEELTLEPVGTPEENPFDAGDETTSVFTQPALAPALERATKVSAPIGDDEDDDLEISVELSTALEHAAEVADVLVIPPPADPVVDEDFYDAIAIEATREDAAAVRTPSPAVAPEPIAEEAAITRARSEDDPDLTPLPVGEEEPGMRVALRVPVAPAAPPPEQRDLHARRAARPVAEISLAALGEGTTPVSISEADRRAFLGLIDTEQLLADEARAATLAFEGAQLCVPLGDFAGALERLETTWRVEPGHGGALVLGRRAALAMGDLERAAGLLERERAGDSSRATPVLAELGAVIADWRGLHSEARALDAGAAAPTELGAGARLAGLAFAGERLPPLHAIRDVIASSDADPRLVSALDLEIAREAERGEADPGRLQREVAERYRTVLGAEGRSPGAALGLLRIAIKVGDRSAERDALEKLAEALPPSLLRTSIERRIASAQLAEGLIDAGRARLVALAEGGDDLAASWLLDEGAEVTGEGEVARLSRLISAALDPGQRAALRYTLAVAEEARGRVGAAIAAYSEAMREAPADRRAGRALERARALGGDKQSELDKYLRVAGTDAGRAEWALVRAAMLLAELDRQEEALARLDEALDRHSTNPEALALHVSIAGALGRPTHSSARLAAAADATSDRAFASILRRQAALLHVAADELQRAFELVLVAGDASEVADFGRWHGRADSAPLRELLKESAEGSSPVVAARALVERASLAENPQDAGEDLRRALVLDPAQQGASALATRLMRLELPAACAALLSERFRALSTGGALAPRDRARLALEVALALAEDGDDLEGATTLLAGIGNGQAGEIVAAELVRLARRRGRDPGLTDAYERALAETPSPDQKAALLYEWACITQRGGDPERAIERLRLAHEALPDAPIYREALERAWERAGDTGRLTELALADLKEAEDTRSRVSAYERLAFIDECLRGDPASARMSYESIADLDQGNRDASRRVERGLISERRLAELVQLYERLGISAAEPALAVALILERARLRGRIEGGQLAPAEVDAAIDNDLRLALFQDSRSRPALREAYARAAERHEVAAKGELASRLAELMATTDSPDNRGSAVFLTRAAQSAAEAGRGEEAKSRFRGAIARADAHLPALLGLLDVALRENDLPTVAEAAEQLQRVHREPSLRREAGLLAAAVVARDLDDRPRAIRLLRAVLEAEPRAELAFERLRIMFVEAQDWAALAELLGARLQLETDGRRLVTLHVELGMLYRDRLADPNRARSELEAALAQEGSNPEALTALADLEEAAGRHAEAAELLLRRAKTERARPVLAELLFRLGVLYTRHLQDPKRAIACLTRVLQVDANRKDALALLADAYAKEWDWTGAFKVLQRLCAMETDPVHRVEFLHRAAQIQEEGFKDGRQALALYRNALEIDPLHIPAVEALARYFDRNSDTQSLRVLVDTTARRLRGRLSGGPRDSAIFHALFRIFTLRRAPDRAALAAGVLDWMGGIEAEERQALERLRTREQYPGGALADPAVEEGLFDARVPAGFRNLMRIVSEPLLKGLRADVRQLGLQRSDRLPKSGHAVRDVANRIAADLGIRDFDLYASAALKRGAVLELADPLAVCLGNELIEGVHEHGLRFLFARMFKMAQMHLALALRLEADALAALTAGVVRQFVPDFAPEGVDPALISTEAARVQKALPKKLLAALQPFAFECAAPSLDLRALAAGVSAAADRAGLLACGAPAPALAMLERMGQGDAARALALFAVGDELPELRRMIGTSIG